jgi:hypothetical protein
VVEGRALVFESGRTADYGVQNEFTVPHGRTLVLAPVKWLIPDNAVYEWRVDGALQGGYTTEYFPYTAASSSGTHEVKVTAKINGVELASGETTVTHTSGAEKREATDQSSAQAVKLYSVVAPGQFGSFGNRLGNFHGFGGFGGHAVFKFDHSVVNKGSGREELRIGGNAFSGWNEPGAIWVSQDDNNNGIPDDTWYELKGSHTFADDTIRRYSVTFRRDFTWVDNLGSGGFSNRSSSTGWAEIPGDLETVTLTGTRLDKDVGRLIDANALWGYADVRYNNISLSNAIQADNTPIHLDFIDFLKIVTMIHYDNDSFGERSPEAQTPTDRAIGDPEMLITGAVDGAYYTYTFTNNSGYDLEIVFDIMNPGGARAPFSLKDGGTYTVLRVEDPAVYIEYSGGNVIMNRFTGGANFTFG